MKANLVESAHSYRCRWDNIVHKKEQSVFRAKCNAFSNEEIELADGEVGRYQILLFVQFGNFRLRSPLHNYLAN